MIRDCTNCVNCESTRGFMVNCRCSYDEVGDDGTKWHIQHGEYCHKSKARNCNHYTEEPYDRDEVFVL